MKIHKYTIGGMMHAVFGAGLIVASSSLYANDKTVAIRVSPFDVLDSSIKVEADIKIMKNLTAGPMVTYRSTETNGVETSTLGYGVRVNWHFNGVFEGGVYISPFYRRYKEEVKNLDGDIRSEPLNVFAAVVGWQWVWGTVNMNLEGGYGLGLVGAGEEKNAMGVVTKTIPAPNDHLIGVVYDFTVGFAF